MSEGSLLAELQEKEERLVLAARYGKNLLEENGRLKQELSALKRDLEILEEVQQISTQLAEHSYGVFTSWLISTTSVRSSCFNTPMQMPCRHWSQGRPITSSP